MSGKLTSISIIIPVYNERKTIATIIDRVTNAQTLGLRKEIIIVNDGSTDSTAHVLRRLKKPALKILNHRKNKGKGTAVRTGIAAASGDIVLIQDADLEYNPDDYPVLIKPFFAGAVVVYGSRDLSGKNRHSSALFHAGGHLITTTTNLLFGSKLTDVPTCYKAFRREILVSLPLRCVRFEFCPEVTALLLKRRIEIIEVPIQYHPRSRKEGKKIRVRDGIKAIATLLRCRINL